MRLMNVRLALLLLLAVGLATVTGAASSLEGRWKLAGDGTCYLDRNDAGPDQCSPIPGRWKLGGDESCYWDDDDSGPNQCDPFATPEAKFDTQPAARLAWNADYF
jgi:hypothetical protein